MGHGNRFSEGPHNGWGVPGPGARRARDGFGGPPPWVGEMFGPGMTRHFGAGGGRGRGPRVRRGDVRAAILDVLSTASKDGAQPLNGYQVIQQIADRSEGAWKPSPGSVYPTIAQLEDEELVVTTQEGGRRALRLTEAGTDYVTAHPEEMAAVWAPFAQQALDDEGSDLKKVVGQTLAAMWQIASTGTSAQLEEAAAVLAETRRRLYTILAEGDPEGGRGE